ncbi:MAG TPA: hypothetical protein DCL86_07920 [Bacteroidales bacterium]|nr:hypothetical protein [Bacteroidales bacterium]
MKKHILLLIRKKIIPEYLIIAFILKKNKCKRKNIRWVLKIHFFIFLRHKIEPIQICAEKVSQYYN